MKKILLGLSLSLSISMMAACGNQTNQELEVEAKVTTTQKQEVKHLPDLVSYFQSKGLTIGDKSEKMYAMIGAIDGFGIIVNGQQVELYEFDPNKDNAQLDSVKSTGKLGVEVAYVNKNFMLADNVDDNIVQLFKEFR